MNQSSSFSSLPPQQTEEDALTTIIITKRRTSSLVVTSANLLSGGLRECSSGETSACTTAGVAAVNAYVRYYNNNNAGQNQTTDQNTLVIPTADYKSPVTLLSRFRYGVNLMIFRNELNWRTWTAPAYTLFENRFEPSTLTNSVDPEFPVLLSNVYTLPTDLWHPYVTSVHYDAETQMAVIYITKQYLDTTVSQIDTVHRLVTSIYRRNAADGCPSHSMAPTPSTHTFASSNGPNITTRTNTTVSVFAKWWQQEQQSIINHGKSHALPRVPQNYTHCYVPVVVYDDTDPVLFQEFLHAMTTFDYHHHHHEAENEKGHSNQRQYDHYQLPPQLIVDVHGHGLGNGNTEYHIQSFPHEPEELLPPTWWVSYHGHPDHYHQVQLTLTTTTPRTATTTNETVVPLTIESIQVFHNDLRVLPTELQQSADYQTELSNIQQYAQEAVETNQRTEVGVPTEKMSSTLEKNGRRPCYAGDCSMGHLVADALRWIENSDVALLPSFLFRGPGWTAGSIRYLELYENVPYASQYCQGTMSGLSLVRVLRHAVQTASFDAADARTKVAGRFLQVSGLQVYYNESNSSQNTSDEKIATIHRDLYKLLVWDRTTQDYQPVERTRLYTFASNTHLCTTFVDYPPLLQDRLVEQGEVPGTKRSDRDILDHVKDYLLQEFGNTSTVYTPSLESRWISIPNTKAQYIEEDSPILLLAWQNRDDCEEGVKYWSPEFLECQACPNFTQVVFSKNLTQLFGSVYDAASTKELLRDTVTLTNQEFFWVNVIPELITLPENIDLEIQQIYANGTSSAEILSTISSTTRNNFRNQMNPTYHLAPNDTLQIGIAFDPSDRRAGTDTSNLVMELTQCFTEEQLGSDSFPASDLSSATSLCPSMKSVHRIEAQLSLSVEQNHLGALAVFGFGSAAFIILTSLSLATWVGMHWNERVILSMQPVFLITLSLGIMIIASSFIFMSFDDEHFSVSTCSSACRAEYWLLAIGYSVTVTALYSKLRRINMLFHQRRFRRVKVMERDVVLPAVVCFVVILVLMSLWTIVDPSLHWERLVVENQQWNSYGKCRLDGRLAKICVALLTLVAAVLFAMTCSQAFVARDISTEFSESRYLGMAVFSWVQLAIVGIPVIFLVDDDNVVAKYSLKIGLLLAFCLSMLLVVFTPILWVKYHAYGSNRYEDSSDVVQQLQRSGVSLSFYTAKEEAQRHRQRYHLNGISGPLFPETGSGVVEDVSSSALTTTGPNILNNVSQRGLPNSKPCDSNQNNARLSRIESSNMEEALRSECTIRGSYEADGCHDVAEAELADAFAAAREDTDNLSLDSNKV